MAILYGTTGDGTTLPVLVDQFGNLLAKGIEGAEGPPGPPGVGELPPDPFEGAILGWEDGELSWLGGSVPLPAGTYGPYTYIPGEGRLDIPQDASALVNGQQLYMSNEKGENATAAFQTDKIFSVGAGPNIWNGWYTTGSDVTGTPSQNNCKTEKSDGGETLTLVFYPEPVPITSPFTFNGASGGSSDMDVVGTMYFTDGTTAKIGWDIANNRPQPGPITWTGEKIAERIEYIANNVAFTQFISIYNLSASGWGAIVDGNAGGAPSTLLTFPSATNFDKFEVGDVVQDPDVAQDPDAKIVDIDAEAVPPTISVSSGSWKGSDGSGSLNGQTEIITEWTGSGSVSVATNGAILLRADNKEWVDDFYVTAPEQRIAARKVATSAIRRKTK